MKKDNNTKEYFKKWQEIKLSDSSRARMKEELDAYISFHAVQGGVRVTDDGRSISQVPRRTLLFPLRLIYMPFIIMIAVVVGGGTSFAAQGAVPGDFLYPVKTEVNESVRSAFAFGADAEARLQAKLIEERVEEAKELKAEGELKGEAAITLANKTKRNAEHAEVALQESVKAETEATANKIIIALTEYNAVVENQTSLVVGISAFEQILVNGGFATELATGTSTISELQSRTSARLSGLQSVIAEHQADISAAVQAELTANLERAEELATDAAVAIEADARRLYDDAATALGEVEAKLSTIGTVEIDTDNGAIIDIDFNNVPAESNDDATTTDEDMDEDGVEVDVEADADASAGDSSLNVDGSVSGELNI